MTKEMLAKQLHDKATRNIALSAGEQAMLDAWYAEQDQAEAEILELAHAPQAIAVIQAQVDTTLNEILETTQRIQELVTQNETLRQKNAQLQQQLPQTLTM